MPTRLACLAAATSLSVSAFAQTTWTSFEDRKGHAIASDTAGGVLMFGGEASTSTGKLLRDTNSFATSGSGPNLTSTWTQLKPFGNPGARTEHAMASGVGTNDTAIFILFGGLEPQTSGPAIPNGETFVYEGGGWGKVTLTAAPSARSGHAMVTDTRRNRVVLFGGFSAGNPVDDLWEYDPVNEAWLQQSPAVSPPGRFNHSLAFHPGGNATDGRVYLFGGSGFKDDTWEYDPWTTSWSNVTPATRPSGRRRAAMSYLPGLDNIVLFGGEDAPGFAANDTWVWNRGAGTWAQSSPPTSPPARLDHAMNFDQVGDHVVLLGGENNGQAVPGTWLWNGFNWIEQNPPPSPRTGIAMTYDSVGNRHPMFGGRAIPGGADLSETWHLDGLNWRQQSPSNTPPARSDAGLAYDSSRNRTVLFGGRTGGPCGTELADTWEWDGQNWSPRTLPHNPPAAGGAQLVFDTLRNVTWLFEGSDMWAYDGQNWEKRGWPGPRAGASHCYDDVRDRVVVYGGASSTGIWNDTWEWDGAWHGVATGSPAFRTYAPMFFDGTRAVVAGGYWGNFNRRADAHGWNGVAWSGLPSLPDPISEAAFAWDPLRNRGVQFGGRRDSSVALAATTEWNGSTWIRPTVSGSPSARYGPSMAFDSATQQLVLFGGRSIGGTWLGDTYLYNGTAWTQVTPASSPSPRGEAAMVSVPNGDALLFGGSGGGSFHNDTWLWDGTTWTPANAPTRPAPRADPALFATSNRTVVFGGYIAGGGIHDDMWEWDGSTWTLLGSGPSTAPTSRTCYGAAYDARRDRVVIFGGRDDCASGNYLNETWEWDGDSWLQRNPIHNPSPRERSKLTYDEARGRVVLFGGSDGTNSFSDTWEWDGNDWIVRLPTSSPPGSAGHGLTFDKERAVTVAFGSAGTWDYGPEFPANIELYGSGCLGPNGVPALQPKPWAGPWLGGQIEVDLINAPSNGLGIFVWGFSETFWSGLPLPLDLGSFVGGAAGCQLFASADVTQIFLSGINPYVSFVLPTQPFILGLRMRAQAGFLPVGSPPVVSNALRMTFGAK